MDAARKTAYQKSRELLDTKLLSHASFKPKVDGVDASEEQIAQRRRVVYNPSVMLAFHLNEQGTITYEWFNEYVAQHLDD